MRRSRVLLRLAPILVPFLLLFVGGLTFAALQSVGLATAGTPSHWDGVAALLFYLCVYAVATIGTFAALEYLGRREASIEAVDELAGLGRTRPLLAAMVAVFMFSLAGIPPLAGFVSKDAILAKAFEAGYTDLNGNGAIAQIDGTLDIGLGGSILELFQGRLDLDLVFNQRIDLDAPLKNASS